MTKIGIMTFHGSHNYGSVLQAYALSKQLALMGNHVEIINLRNAEQRKAYRIFKKDLSFRGILQTIFTAVIYKQLKTRFDKYENFIANVLPITDREYSSGEQLKSKVFDYDVYICGSDQIWNPVCQDFETAYYLDFVKNGALKLAYAPSLGRTEFNERTLALIEGLVQNLNYIAVREKQGAELIRRLINKPVGVVCDPVVLLDKKHWDDIIVEPKFKKPYILTYFLANNHGDKSLLNYFQEKTGFEAVILNEYIRDHFKSYFHAYDAGPGEFLGLFKNAALVYTNSFHGTAFSTIFNRPFFTSVARDAKAINNNDSRKIDYLERIGLEHRIITDKLPKEADILTTDYSEANKKIQEFRDHSLRYLGSALSARHNCMKNGDRVYA